MEKLRLISANFVASLGSGWILATGLELSTFHENAWGDSILAFLIGSSISVILSSYSRSKGLTVPTWLCSTLSLVTLLPLASTWRHVFLFHPFCLVALLSLFFSFTLLARTERMAFAAKTTSLIFPVELAYSVGNGISLLALASFPVQSSNLIVAVAISLCTLAAVLDLFRVETIESNCTAETPSLRKIEILPIALEFSSLTIATQVVAQIFARLLQSSAPLGAFDVGTTLAPILCATLGLSYVRMPGGDFIHGKNGQRFPQQIIIKSIFGLMLLACIAHLSLQTFSQVVSLPAILSAAFLYEIFCLVRMEEIGQTAEGRKAIPVVFSAMAVTATATYSVFLIGDIGSMGILILLSTAFGLPLISFRRAGEIAGKF